MAQNFQDPYKRIVGEGLFDQEVEDLPPRFKIRFKELEKKLYDHIETLRSKVVQQNISQCSTTNSPNNICTGRNTRVTSYAKPYHRTFENSTSDLRTVKTTSNHDNDCITNQVPYSKTNMFQTQKQISSNYDIPNCSKNEFINHHSIEEKRNAGAHQNNGTCFKFRGQLAQHKKTSDNKKLQTGENDSFQNKEEFPHEHKKFKNFNKGSNQVSVEQINAAKGEEHFILQKSFKSNVNKSRSYIKNSEVPDDVPCVRDIFRKTELHNSSVSIKEKEKHQGIEREIKALLNINHISCESNPDFNYNKKFPSDLDKNKDSSSGKERGSLSKFQQNLTYDECIQDREAAKASDMEISGTKKKSFHQNITIKNSEKYLDEKNPKEAHYSSEVITDTKTHAENAGVRKNHFHRDIPLQKSNKYFDEKRPKDNVGMEFATDGNLHCISRPRKENSKKENDITKNNYNLPHDLTDSCDKSNSISPIQKDAKLLDDNAYYNHKKFEGKYMKSKNSASNKKSLQKINSKTNAWYEKNSDVDSENYSMTKSQLRKDDQENLIPYLNNEKQYKRNTSVSASSSTENETLLGTPEKCVSDINKNKKATFNFSCSMKSSEVKQSNNNTTSVSNPSPTQNKTLFETPQKYSQSVIVNNSNTLKNKMSHENFSGNMKSNRENHQISNEKKIRNNAAYLSKPLSAQSITLLESSKKPVESVPRNNLNTPMSKNPNDNSPNNVKSSGRSYQRSNNEQYKNSTTFFPKLSSTDNVTLPETHQTMSGHKSNSFINKKSNNNSSCNKKPSKEIQQMSHENDYKTNTESFLKSSYAEPCWDEDLFEISQKCLQTTADHSSHEMKHSDDEASCSLKSSQESYLPILEVIDKKNQECQPKLHTDKRVQEEHIEVFSPNQGSKQQVNKASGNASTVVFDKLNKNQNQVTQKKLVKCESSRAGSTASFAEEQNKTQQQNQNDTILRTNNNFMNVGAFSLKVEVSEKVDNLSYWQKKFKSFFRHDRFKIQNPLSSLLTVFFETKEEALKARQTLLKKKSKEKLQDSPYVTQVSGVKCAKDEADAKEKIISDCLTHIDEVSTKCINSHNTNILSKEEQLNNKNKTEKSALLEEWHGLKKMKYVFQAHIEGVRTKVTNLKNCNENVNYFKEVKQAKASLHRECNSFKRCLPVYAEKDEILKTVKNNQVSVIVAETGSGKSTELVNYLLQAGYANYGLIICTQPRKIAAISISEFVSGQLGSPVGNIVGYDVGTTEKSSSETNILFMTEFSFLRRCLKNPNLKGISCIIVDEAHERTLYTDILLGIIKSRIKHEPQLRIIITSATIDPEVFLCYFGLLPKSVLKILGRIYPVKIIWSENNVSVGWNYVEECVKTAIKVHLYEKPGDILVFLTSPNETEDAVNLFNNHFNNETSSKAPKLYCLHGKLDTFDQIEIFKPTPNQSRKIIFATNSAETSVTIPGVKYVIDSGMVKEMQYCAQRNKNTLHVNFISKSSAEQRKGRAGRNQPGVCYRLYSKFDFSKMKERTEAEILKTNFQLALLKILEFGFQPDNFDFIEKPSENMISKSWDSLEHLGAVKNKSLTDLGKKIVRLNFEPCLSKLIFQGIAEKIGYEAAIIAALLSISGKVFFRTEENKVRADRQKIKFCKKEGDILTFLEVFKQWEKLPENNKSQWCSEHFINFKSMKTAFNIVKEIIRIFNKDFSILIPRRYNDFRFKSSYETILFECYSENICIFSGHPKSGYVSPYLTESYFIHPSSSLSYIGCEDPLFVLYGTVIETSRNFLLDVTPIKEDTILKAYQNGSFNLQIEMLKYLQVVPKVIGPFGESVLIRYILGKQGSKIMDLEFKIKEICKINIFYIEVLVEKGQIVVYIEKRFHDRVLKLIYTNIERALAEMNKEELIQKINSCSFSIGSGAVINDIILPGEFRELIFDMKAASYKVESFLSLIRDYGDVQSVTETIYNDRKSISVVFFKAASAEKALFHLKKQKFNVTSKINLPNTLTSVIMYRIQVSWCRIPCKGKGWIEFNTPEECIDASGTLTSRSIYVDDNYIQFAPTPHSDKELYMKNLPATADEEVIKELLEQYLQSQTIKSVTLVRENIVKVVEREIVSAKKELLNLFQKFTPLSKLVIDVKYPSSNDLFWNALVHFENLNDGEKAFTSLQNKAKVGNYALKMKPVLNSFICCRSKVHEILTNEIHSVILKYKSDKICSRFDAQRSSRNPDMINLKFTCEDINGLSRLYQELGKLVQGYSFCLQDKFNVLRTGSGKAHLDNLEKNLKIIIALDSRLRTVCLYGPEKDCLIAKNKIQDFANRMKTVKQKVFNLKGVNTPSGFLKTLYKKYGFSLNEFIDKYDLNSASINIHKRTLTIEGVQDNIEQAEECLETICSEIINEKSKDNLKGDEEFCEICCDSITSDYHRLEHCGHPFCKSCLLLQLESKIFPVTCVKENCGKPLFIEDINRIVSYGSKEVRGSFFSAALQYFVQNNKDSIRYCPRPNCQMVYRSKDVISKVTCLECENEICANCDALYHYGMTCDMFQNSQKDENYSLKVWVREDQSMRKKCPTCSTVIEKDGGCNHVECLLCKNHMCWLCLTTFPSSKDVYNHLPMCPKNFV